MKAIVVAFCIMSSCLAMAYPHGPRHGQMHSPRLHHRPPPPPRHHHGSFWTGFGTDLVVEALRPAPAPVVIQSAPVGYVPGRVWVPGHYEMRPVYDAFGIIRYERVYVPGYWQ